MEIANTSSLSSIASAPLRRRVVIIAFTELTGSKLAAGGGKRVGETHHNARIPDVVVDKIRDRHEDDGISYKSLAVEFSLSLNTIKKICTYQRRAQTPARYKRVTVFN